MSDEKIDIRGLNKADVLAALYNASKPQGMGFMHYDPTPMTMEEAQCILKQGSNFDYLKGRVMKVDLSADEFYPRGYDRDNGPGAARAAMDTLRGSKDINAPQIQKMHNESTLESAIEALSEFANVLGPKVDQAMNW